MHQDAFVLEIGLEHAGFGERHPHRHRFVVELEHGDVLELVPFFFADVNFSPGKLIDHLVAAEERHRVIDQFPDRKSTRLNSSHEWISYAVFCLKKKITADRWLADFEKAPFRDEVCP